MYDCTLFSDTDGWQWVIKMADPGIQSKGNVGFIITSEQQSNAPTERQMQLSSSITMLYNVSNTA